MKTIVISMFVFPWEIDALERVLIGLKEASFNIDQNVKFKLSLTMELSWRRVDWQQSEIPRQFFIDKLYNLKTLCNWCDYEFDINGSNAINGAADKKRSDLAKFKDEADVFMWLDTDIYFPKHILYAISTFVSQIKEPYYVITPEIIKYWDNSWDCITNKKYLSQPFNHRDFFDMFSLDNECQSMDGAYLESINQFKFGAGWFTCLSKELFVKATMPDFIGEYGPDDTWIMMFCQAYNQKHRNRVVKQHLMRNVVITELGKIYIVDNHYKKYLKLNPIDIDAHKDKVWQVFNEKLIKHMENVA
jgi:hypothetical protein